MEHFVLQPSRILFLAGVLTAGAISLAGLAYAGDSGLKTLSLQLSGGQVAQIEPFTPTAAEPPAQIMAAAYPMTAAAPMGGNPFAPRVDPGQANPFAQFDRLSAMIDRQAAAMTQIIAVASMPEAGLSLPASVGQSPAGSQASFAFIAVSSGLGGGCMRSIQITNGAPGQAPHVVRHMAGACGSPQPGMTAAPPVMRARDLHGIAVAQSSQT